MYLRSLFFICKHSKVIRTLHINKYNKKKHFNFACIIFGEKVFPWKVFLFMNSIFKFFLISFRISLPWQHIYAYFSCVKVTAACFFGWGFHSIILSTSLGLLQVISDATFLELRIGWISISKGMVHYYLVR